MSFYERHVLPRFLSLACGMEVIGRQRAKIVPLATGRVLEIGIGSGLNLPYYDPARLQEVIGLDPSAELRRQAERAAARVSFPVSFLGLEAEQIPLPAASIDTVLVTYTLCTIPDVEAALREMRRVLKPEGRLLFCEHGRAPDPKVARWQDRLTPVWRRIAGGCHLNRAIPALIEGAGFRIHDIARYDIPGPRPWTFHYRGVAEPGL